MSNAAIVESAIQGYRISPQQERLWLLTRDHEQTPYRAQCALRIDGAIDALVVQRAVRQVAERHEILRTTFQYLPGMILPVQVISNGDLLAWEEHDLTGLSKREQRATVETLRHGAWTRPLDFSCGPLLNLTLLKLGQTSYLLVVTLPALCADSATLRNVSREIARACAVGGDDHGAEDACIQYADFAEWQHSLLDADGDPGRTYWRKEALSHSSSMFHTRLPFELSTTESLAFGPLSRSINISADLAGRINKLAESTETSVAAVFIACWQVLLDRLTDQATIRISAACDNRIYREFEQALGPFSKFLPVYCGVERELSFRATLAKFHAALSATRKWQEYFVWDEINPSARDAWNRPFFHFCYEFDEQPVPYVADGVSIDLNRSRVYTDRFKVMLGVMRKGSLLEAALHYDASIYPAGSITTLAHQYETLLSDAVCRPDEAVMRLRMLSDVERQKLLYGFNPTQACSPQDTCLHELVEAQVIRTPEATAVVCGDQSLRYLELDRRANQLARCLLSRGVGPDVLVAISIERSIEIVVGLLGILRAGGAYVPIDPWYPKDRIRVMLEDSCVSLLLTQERLLENLPAANVDILCLDRDWPLVAQYAATAPNTCATSSNLAYVIFTSGSTGRPKGVMVSHDNAVQSTRARNTYYHEPIRSFLLLSSIAFDSSVAGLFWTLSKGGCLCIPDEEAQKDPLALSNLISQLKVSHLLCLPSFYTVLLQQITQVQAGSVCTVIVAGEACSPDVVAQHYGNLYQALLFNEYGPTEGTVWTSVYHVGIPDRELTVPIGSAIAHTQIYILDTSLELVPIGISGELYIGGAGLARGYLNRPELTAERFIPNPFSNQPGERLYRTGDLARYRSDGNLEYLGRIDHQVKVRGFRIELGEIEARLLEHPQVKEAVVIAREDTPGEKRLVGYVVGKGEEAVPAMDELRAYLQRLLPEYMVPGVFVFLEALPLTPNGKVDRKGLTAPDLSGHLAHQYVAPRNPTEEMLANIWAEVLGVERVGGHDNFFVLGGHSLLATQVVSRIRTAFAIELPLRALFESPTVGALGLVVEAAQREAGGVSLHLLVPVPRTEALPLSYAQQRLWFLDQLEPGGVAYNVPRALRLVGYLDIAAFERSLDEIVRRHEVLRTTFAMVEGQAVQVIAPELKLAIPMLDLSQLPEAQREAEVSRVAMEEAGRSFDLSVGPLVRVSLLALREDSESGVSEHVVLFTLHHIVSDGWSTDILVPEFVGLYEAFSQGQPSPLPELPIQYADYAVWQREWLQGEVLERQLSYWKEQLAGAPAVLSLPTDRPRPAAQSYRGASYAFTLSEELTVQLRALSRREGVTLFMTLLAAFQLLLSRYSGQRDICVGSPIANRNRVEIERLIGFFVNTLVLRADLSSNPTFTGLLTRVREVCLDAQAHQDVPFEKLVEELQPLRDMSHSPLFQVMLVLQNTPSRELELAGLHIHGVDTETETAKFDLTLTTAEVAGGLEASLEYATDVFDEITIVRLAGHFQVLLEAIVAHPESRLSELPLLTEAERRQLLIEWNATATEYSNDTCIHQLFEAQVAKTPEACAVACGAARLTYRELNARANRAAHGLSQLGVGPDALVALLDDRDVEFLVMMLGIFKAGGAYVPLDPAHPDGRMVQVLEESRVRFILCGETYRARAERLIETAAVSALTLVSLAELERHQDLFPNPPRRHTEQNLAFVIYTSGSTGKPKGAMVEHRGMFNNLITKVPALGLTGTDVIAQTASQCFDISVWQFLTALVIGARVEVFPDEISRDPARLFEQLTARGVTILETVPSMIRALLEISDAGTGLPALRWLMPCGEAFPPELCRRWMQRFPDLKLLNAYGPAECSDDVSYHPIELPGEGDLTVPIGRPVHNTRLYLLNPWFEPVPIGVPGEICVGGVQVGRGYLNRSDLTAAAFIPDPFGEEGGRLYRSGDLGRYRSDGVLEFLGRIDHQVKIRGHRIEPGEIEACLVTHPEVREACVVPREVSEGVYRLVAYMAGAVGEVGELRAHILKTLPDYMVPAAFVFLEVLPLTPNGKVDRKRLPDPDIEAQLAHQYVAPRNATEEILANIWAEVLGVERVGMHDNFFVLGGHSLLASQVVSRIRTAFAIELPLRALFESPTVGTLGLVVVATQREAGGAYLPALVPVSRTEALPLSYAQQRLWFLDQLEPGGVAYNIPEALRLMGHLDIEAFERSIDDIIRRHEVLRTTFAMVEGHARQVIAPELKLSISTLDLSHLPQAHPEAEARRLASEEARRPFDLAVGPLLRVSLLNLGEDSESGAPAHVVLFTLHHIVSDGWSMDILVQEFVALYDAFSQSQPSPLPDLSIQYADYAVWQREWLQGEVLERQLSYWREQLVGAPEVLTLPTDRPRPAVQSYRGASYEFTLSPSLTEQLYVLSRREGVTLFMTLLAVFQLLLFRYSGQRDICVGSPIANRNRIEIEGLIGFFVNTLVLRTDLSGNPTFTELLARVREVCLGAQAHQDVPFEKLVEELQPLRDMSHSPLFQVMLVLQNTPSRESELAGLHIRGVEAETETAKFDLTLSMAEWAGGLEASFEYATDLFDEVTIVRLEEHLQVLLAGIVAHPESRVSELPLLTEPEREQLLMEWNATETDYPKDKYIHQLFEAQVERSPQATAVVHEEQSLTYAELNAKANQLAHHLCSLGVGPDILVGICVERSLEMVVGLLGILKAGGAYLPLDPEYPMKRLAYMLEDARPSVLLTQVRLREVLPAHPEVFCLDGDWLSLARQSSKNPPNLTSPLNLAYVIYTSGSTGRPKGVGVVHTGLRNRLLWMQERFDLSATDRVLQKTPYTFDVSVWEFFWPLMTGAQLVVSKPGEHKDPVRLMELIDQHAVTTLHFVPSMLQVFLNGVAQERCPSVKRVICSGEGLSVDLQRRFFECIGSELHNLYGPTEASIDVTAWRGIKEDNEANVPIGWPIANTQTYVLDQDFNPIPVGVTGELHLGGVQLARGYLNRPDLTAERFIPNPFGEAGSRLYRTGDLAWYRMDGNLEYLGRIDHQVKVRGFRIELGEIEARLIEHPQVKEAVVLAREDGPGERRLVGYVVGKDEGAVAVIDELRTYLQPLLPEYMVPAAFVLLDALPLTPNGKVDRKGLPAPDIGVQLAHRYVAPRTSTEEVLARIWADVLGVERVGIHDNFFALGGHSLLAVTLIERAHRQGLEMDVRALFTTPTVAELAAVVGGERVVEVPPNVIPAQCEALTPEMLPLVALEQAEIDCIVGQVPSGLANVQDIYPLAPLQEGILFHHLIATEGDAYLMPSLLAFDTRARLEGFLGALQSVINRHDILRTAVVWEGLPEPVQVVWREAPLVVEEVTLDAEAGDMAEQLRFDPRSFRLDVRQAPLVRGVIARDTVQERWLLLLLSHHLIDDNTTLRFALNEVQAYLLRRFERLPAPLPFRNFVAQARLGVSREEHEIFFRAMLGDVDEPTAPFGLLDVQGEGSGIEEASLDLDVDLSRRLRARARSLGVSAASLCHLAFAQVLARLSGRKDVVFGTVLFGRMQGGEGADRVLGMFINTLPVRITLGEEGVEEAVRRTHRCLAELLRHEHASLPLAQRCSAVPSPAPLFSALLNYRHSPEDTHAGAELAWEGIEMLDGEERTNYPVTLSVDDLGEGFGLTAQVQSPTAPERLCGYMQTVLTHLVEALETAPQTAVRTLEVLPEPERHQLLNEWNATQTDYPQDKCIHQLFEAQVERSPQATAVVYEDEPLTYRELNAKANQLAHHLCSLGVGPDTLVGICVERSFEMIIGLLGILKAGGAYLPLDAEYPKERLAYMLEDARPSVLLTQVRLREVLPAHHAVFCLDGDWLSLARQSSKNPPNLTSPLNLAYVIYTSGSTGRPKGVATAHQAVVRLVKNTNYARLGSEEVVLQFAPLAFDASTFEIWAALANGACIVSAPARQLTLDELGEVIRRHAITTVWLTPALFNQMVEHRLDDFRGVRQLLAGGDVLSAHHVRKLQQFLPTCQVINGYGPTENTTFSTYHSIGLLADTVTAVPIGKPIANSTAYVLDGNLYLTPVDVPGELYIGGAGLARGYLNRPELTAERFIPNPFSDQPGERLYRTGDLARYRVDGNIEYLGRTDHQVKIRGFRIELGEIEARLLEHPQVKEAVVLAREDVPGERRLVGYVVGKDEGAVPVIDELRTYLQRLSPEHMVPAAFVLLDALPLTPNAKVDRKGLPAPDVNAQLADQYVAPRNPNEWILAKQFAGVLNVDRVGIHDNFFHLGGHSLLALRLMERVRKTADSTLPLTAIFQAPTVALLAEWMSENVDRAKSPLITMRSGYKHAPLYCIHPGAGGTVIMYQALANAQNEGRAVYGIQSRVLFDPTLRTTSIEAMAEDYVQLIYQSSPSPRYNLIGYSMGGFIALAMAAKIEALGADVAFLGIIDTQWPIERKPLTVLDHIRDFCDLLEIRIAAIANDAEVHQLKAISNELSSDERFIYACRWGQQRGHWSDESIEFLRWLYASDQHDDTLLRNYQPKSVSATIHAWWALKSLSDRGEPPIDWFHYTSGIVKTQVVDGDHESIIGSSDLITSVAFALRLSE